MKQGDYSTGLIAIQEGTADVIRERNKLKLTHWEFRRMSEDTIECIRKVIDDRRRKGVADPAQ